jgi:hypothetical protein
MWSSFWLTQLDRPMNLLTKCCHYFMILVRCCLTSSVPWILYKVIFVQHMSGIFYFSFQRVFLVYVLTFSINYEQCSCNLCIIFRCSTFWTKNCRIYGKIFSPRCDITMKLFFYRPLDDSNRLGLLDFISNNNLRINVRSIHVNIFWVVR